MKKKRSLIGSTFAKLVAFFLLAIGTFVGVAAAVGTFYLTELEIYTYSHDAWVKNSLQDSFDGAERYVCNILEAEEWEELLAEYFEDSNLDVRVYKGKQLLWSDYTDYGTPYVHKFKAMTRYDLSEDRVVSYDVELYLDPSLPERDVYRTNIQVAELLYRMQTAIPIVAVCCMLSVILCFIFLMCAAGHKNGQEGIVPSVLASIPLDLLTVLFAVVAAFGILCMVEGIWYSIGSVVPAAVLMLMVISAEAVWLTIFCMEVAGRMKAGNWWNNTIVVRVLRLIKRFFCAIGRGVLFLLKSIPMSVDAIIVFVIISFTEFACLLLWSVSADMVLLWGIEKLLLLPLLLYVVGVCRRLQKGSKALAGGELSGKLDTKGMILGFKDHADNLNDIKKGMELAVEERMKSEHLKTELVTNVSHDIKTPLTSVINYADLLGNAVMTTPQGVPLDREKIAEYTDVLLRQSQRMKKLLEDLVEVSKATTGNLEVQLAPCEIGVLLSQAVGEYEQRFEQKGLKLLVKQPEEPVRIMTDGRHLWRIFDNLMNNIFKYAQENTRVYLSVEPKEDRVEIIFRNMSKYMLDVTAKELEERFVRGDKSRHMEGSGLGLSIAKSLTDLLGGSLEIVTDGDLFKVILGFQVLPE